MHRLVRSATDRLAKRSATRHHVSPRDFLDLIRKFVGIVREKREDLEEQQRHLHVGLDRLAETQSSVADLQGSLANTEVKLKEKNHSANGKLSLMLDKQQEAEKEKLSQQQFSVQLETQDKEIAARTLEVQQELAEAEPALLSAREAVSGIKKTQLDEVRALRNPPKLVQHTMEAVCLMLGHRCGSWDELRKIIRQDGFIQDVIGFDSSKQTNAKQIDDVKRKYMDEAGITIEQASNKSSTRRGRAGLCFSGRALKWSTSTCSTASRLLRKRWST